MTHQGLRPGCRSHGLWHAGPAPAWHRQPPPSPPHTHLPVGVPNTPNPGLLSLTHPQFVWLKLLCTPPTPSAALTMPREQARRALRWGPHCDSLLAKGSLRPARLCEPEALPDYPQERGHPAVLLEAPRCLPGDQAPQPAGHML